MLKRFYLVVELEVEPYYDRHCLYVRARAGLDYGGDLKSVQVCDAIADLPQPKKETDERSHD
jgi:hypothetical protein